MTPAELAGVLQAHSAWLRNNGDGKRADLRGANLRGADLGQWRILSLGPIGSRQDTLTHKRCPAVEGRDAVDEVTTGCFRGTLAEFEAANEARSDGNTVAQEQYRLAIAFLRAAAALTPVTTHEGGTV